MSNLWKGLIVLSLALNVILFVRISKLTPSAPSATSAPSDAPSDAPPTTSDYGRGGSAPAVVPAQPDPVVETFTEDTSSLARKTRDELFPELITSMSKNHAIHSPDKLDLSNGRVTVMMKSVNVSRTEREQARGFITRVTTLFVEKKPELKGRAVVVRFPEDPPPRGQ